METRAQILETSFQLFRQYGVRSITMDDIAKHLSISKKTLYKYFRSKKDLVFEVMKNTLSEMEGYAVNTFSASDNAVHELFLLMDMIRGMFHGINKTLLYDLQKYHPKSWKLMEEHRNEFVHDMIAKTLRRGVKEGLFREDLNIRVLTRLRLEEMKVSFDSSVFPPFEYNMEEVQIVMMEHFILGITTLKGHEMALEYQKKMKNDKN